MGYPESASLCFTRTLPLSTYFNLKSHVSNWVMCLEKTVLACVSVKCYSKIQEKNIDAVDITNCYI